MLKVIIGFIAGIALLGIVGFNTAGSFMMVEHESPYGIEETAARIQANILKMEHRGWTLSGLRDPAKAVANSGRNVPPVLLVEACSTDYSGVLLADDQARILSIMMPCTITIYKKDDGKTYIGTMNSGLMGRLFGKKVASVMDEVAKDQAEFLKFDDSQPAPPLIRVKPGGGSAGGPEAAGC